MTDVPIPVRTSTAAGSADARADPRRLGAALRHLDLFLVAVAVPVTWRWERPRWVLW